MVFRYRLDGKVEPMARFRRMAAFALMFAALGATVTGVVVAATDANPSSSGKDPLALNGYPPHSALLRVVISTGQTYDVSALVNVNFLTRNVEANILIPFFFSSTRIDVRLVHRHLYAGSPNLSSLIGAPWLSIAAAQPTLFGLALELTRPDISLISGFSQTHVSTSGQSTTYTYHRDAVTITAPSGLPVTLPTKAAVDFSLTLGSQGELTASSFAVTSKTSTASISATVLSYNGPAHIVAPPKSVVKPVNSAFLKQLFGSTSLGGLLSPKGSVSLPHVSLS